MTQQTQKVEPTATEAEALRAKLIVRLDNDLLLNLAASVRELSKNLDSGSWYDAPKALKDERDGLLKEIKIFSDALDQEYKKRLLRGYRLELQKLLAALQPKAPEVQGRKLIPINASVAGEGESSQSEGTPEALLLLEQLRCLLLVTPGADVAKEDRDRSGPTS